MQSLNDAPAFTVNNSKQFADPMKIACYDLVITNGGYVYIDCYDRRIGNVSDYNDYFFVVNILDPDEKTFYNVSQPVHFFDTGRMLRFYNSSSLSNSVSKWTYLYRAHVYPSL